MLKLRSFEGRRFVESLEPRRLLAVTPFFVEIPISAAAKAADPDLLNYRTFDLRATVTNSPAITKLGTADLNVVLTQGQFYVPQGDLDQKFPQKNLWTAHPNLEFDTFLAAPNFNPPVIFGRSFASTSPFTDDTFSSTEVDAGFGPPPPLTAGAGTYTIARLTVSNDAIGTAVGRVMHSADPRTPFYFGASLPDVADRATLIGGLFWDRNGSGNIGNGAVSAGDLSGTVYIDDNDNGVLDDGEKSGKTYGGSNLLIFPGITAGQHRVRQVPVGAFAVTTPLGNAIDVSLSPNQTIDTIRFGNYAPNVGGVAAYVWNDDNGDGLRNDQNGLIINGITMYLDLNNNAQFDSGEPNAVTGSTAWIGGVPFGQYMVRQVVPAGQQVTSPGGNARTVTVDGYDWKWADFGNYSNAANSPTVFGFVFRDNNDNGILESSDLGLPNATVYVDINFSRGLDAGDIATVTGSDGSYRIENVPAGEFWVFTIPPRGYRRSSKIAAGQSIHFEQLVALRWISAMVPVTNPFSPADPFKNGLTSFAPFDETLLPISELLV